MDNTTVLTTVCVPIILGAIPAYFLHRKNRRLIRIAEHKAQGDNFNNILAATKTIREELAEEKKELRLENSELRNVQSDMAKRIISLANEVEDISKTNNALFKHLKIILGMKTIIDIKLTKIFVLEDNEHDLFLIKRLFNANNIENVYYFTTYKEFYDKIDSDVRILIIDYKLDNVEMNGIEVIKKVLAVNDYRYFIMLSGMEDFDIIYRFNRLITHGVYVLKGKLESNELLVTSIKNTLYYLKLLSDTYNEISTK